MSDAVRPSGVRGRGPAERIGVSPWLAVVVDVVLVLVFAAVGRRSHGEAVVVGLAHTAWPFLAGTVLGWIVVLAAARRPPIAPRDGIVVWLATVAAGMALRAATGAGVAGSFVVVATIVTAVFLVGWRLVATAASARGARRGA